MPPKSRLNLCAGTKAGPAKRLCRIIHYYERFHGKKQFLKLFKKGKGGANSFVLSAVCPQSACRARAIRPVFRPQPPFFRPANKHCSDYITNFFASIPFLAYFQNMDFSTFCIIFSFFVVLFFAKSEARPCRRKKKPARGRLLPLHRRYCCPFSFCCWISLRWAIKMARSSRSCSFSGWASSWQP